MVLLIVVAQVVALAGAWGAARWIIRHDERREREQRWTGERWVTVADEAADWLRGGAGPPPA